ncbi:MAG: hypothetical protein AB7T63_01440 [Planctomycetota bacterium]
MDRGQDAADEPGEGRAPVARRAVRARVQFSIGTALSRSFSIFARYLPLWLLIGVVAYAPVHFYALHKFADLPVDASQGQLEAFRKDMQVTQLVIAALGFVLGLLVQVFTTHATLVHMEGGRVRIADSLAASFARLPVALGTVLLMLLVFVGLGAVAVLAFKGAPFLLLILFIPAVMLWFAWFLGPQVAVAERTSPGRSLGRSALLTKGQRLSLFAGLLLLGLLAGIVRAVVGFVAGGDLESMVVSDLSPARNLLWIQAPVDIASTALMAIFAAVAYHDLRVSKDGVSSKDLADIFA